MTQNINVINNKIKAPRENIYIICLITQNKDVNMKIDNEKTVHSFVIVNVSIPKQNNVMQNKQQQQ